MTRQHIKEKGEKNPTLHQRLTRNTTSEYDSKKRKALDV